MKKTYTFQEFKEIVEHLRSKDGCPWDRVQTHESLKPCMTEEAAEVNAAIRILDQTGDSENLCEELGDVLLQVVMHSQIAQEKDEFTLEDVISMVSEKMIRRHPHVFGQVQADTPEKVLVNWEAIKTQEKEGKTMLTSELRDVPLEFPALIRGQKVLKKAANVYGVKKEIEDSIKTVQENLEALKHTQEAKESMGQILLELVNIAQIQKIYAEQTLLDAIDEFIEKYE